MNRLIHFAALTLLLNLLGCSAAKDNGCAEGENCEGTDSVQVFIESKIQGLSDINCDTDENTCSVVTVEYDQSSFNEDKTSADQTILVLDTSLDFIATVRYRSRIKAMFRLEEGQYTEYAPSYEIPEFVHSLLSDIDSFSDSSNDYKFIPAAELTSVYDALTPIYEYESYSEYVGHGQIPLSYLLEHNPYSELVLADPPLFYSHYQDWFCDPTPENISLLTQAISNAAMQFQIEIIEEQEIEYVNYSGGISLATINSQWQSICNSDLPEVDVQIQLLNTMHPFFDMLFNNSGVWVFQASDINMTEQNNPFDLDIENEFENRLLVADFTTGEQNSDIPQNGIMSYESSLPYIEKYQESYEHIDYFLNFGIESSRPFPYNDTPVMETGILGLTYDPITSIQPSWAAPVALSRAIHLKNTEFPDQILTNELIQQIWDLMTPSSTESCRFDFQSESMVLCKIQDPLKHRQHELFRLGYLD